MTGTQIPFAASFWLGRIHSSILAILHSDESNNLKLQKVEELETELRDAVDKLYYANNGPSCR